MCVTLFVPLPCQMSFLFYCASQSLLSREAVIGTKKRVPSSWDHVKWPSSPKGNSLLLFQILLKPNLCYLCCMVYFNGGIINHRYCRFQFCGVMQMAFISRSIDFSVFLMGDFNGQLVKSAVCTTALHHGAKHKDIKGNIDKWNRSTQICISFLSNF